MLRSYTCCPRPHFEGGILGQGSRGRTANPTKGLPQCPFPTKWVPSGRTHRDYILPAGLQPFLKHTFKALRPLSLLLRRSSRDVNSPAPINCQLSQWSAWTDCFPCQEKKVRLHRYAFIYFQMCLQRGCTHINYIYYTYSSFWSIP